MMTQSRSVSFVAIGVGLVLIVAGITLGTFGPVYLNSYLNQQLQLTPTSKSFNLWVHTPFPLYLEIYLFNFTNAADFIKNKATVPHFEEVGPFVFKEVHDRVNITWNDDNSISYNQTRKWVYVPEESQDLYVNVTNVNVIATTISRMARKYPEFKSLINFEFDKFEKLVVTDTAKNWIFSGIDDNLLNIIKVLQKLIKFPPLPEKFAWFYKRNMSSSYDGRFRIQTGKDDIYKVGILNSWNNMTKTKYFDGECGMVNGTAGELFPPMNYAQDNITVFISDICSSITLKRNESAFVKGIKSYTFVGDEATLDNGQLYPEKKCFCKGECAPSGARDVSPCRIAPLFFSFPHFYLADNSYRKSVSGMKPNKTEHEFLIQIDPVTGLPTNVKAQFQINVLLEPISWLNMFRDVPKVYIPMMWFREKATVTSDLASQTLFMHIAPYISIGFCCLVAIMGIVLFSVFLLKLKRSYRDSADAELLIPPIMDDN